VLPSRVENEPCLEAETNDDCCVDVKRLCACVAAVCLSVCLSVSLSHVLTVYCCSCTALTLLISELLTQAPQQNLCQHTLHFHRFSSGDFAMGIMSVLLICVHVTEDG